MTQPPGQRLPDKSSALPRRSDSTAASAQAQRLQSRIAQDAHRICPGCGTSMTDRGCKLRCTRCGFFLDCSDG